MKILKRSLITLALTVFMIGGLAKCPLEPPPPDAELICCCPVRMCIFLPQWAVDEEFDDSTTIGDLSFMECNPLPGQDGSMVLQCCAKLAFNGTFNGGDGDGDGPSGNPNDLNTLGCFYNIPVAEGETPPALIPTDTDLDGICDFCDNCQDVQNGLGDPIESTVLNTTSGLGIVASGDGDAPDAFNVDQADTDSDGVGDACDNCVLTVNPDQEDSNNDGVGNACEGTECPVTPVNPAPVPTSGQFSGAGFCTLQSSSHPQGGLGLSLVLGLSFLGLVAFRRRWGS